MKRWIARYGELALGIVLLAASVAHEVTANAPSVDAEAYATESMAMMEETWRMSTSREEFLALLQARSDSHLNETWYTNQLFWMIDLAGVVLLIAGGLRALECSGSLVSAIRSSVCCPAAYAIVAAVMWLGLGGPLHEQPPESVMMLTMFVLWPALIVVYFVLFRRCFSAPPSQREQGESVAPL